MGLNIQSQVVFFFFFFDIFVTVSQGEAPRNGSARSERMGDACGPTEGPALLQSHLRFLVLSRFGLWMKHDHSSGLG